VSSRVSAAAAAATTAAAAVWAPADDAQPLAEVPQFPFLPASPLSPSPPSQPPLPPFQLDPSTLETAVREFLDRWWVRLQVMGLHTALRGRQIDHVCWRCAFVIL